jgi:hypothetical protein
MIDARGFHAGIQVLTEAHLVSLHAPGLLRNEEQRSEQDCDS